MNKELKDCTTEELEARFDELTAMSEMVRMGEVDQTEPWNNWVAIDAELGKRS